MKKIILLGGGRQGRTAAEFLKKRGVDVTIADINESNLSLTKKLGYKIKRVDLSKKENIKKISKDYDLVISALPASLGRVAEISTIEAGKNLVDLSYLPEDPFELNSLATKMGVTLIPDAGVAPGISNFIIGHLSSYFDKMDNLKIFVGGIPEKNIPPLGYTLTWSPIDLVEEYTRPARIKRDSKIIAVPALSGVEEIQWKGIDRLEAFYTDGLRTLLTTMKDIKDMEEKTIRYKGHAEKMKFLIEMGYFKDNCNGLSPLNVSLCLFKKISSKLENLKDLLLLRIIVGGIKSGKKVEIVYELFDRGNNKHTAMERTTGFGCGMLSYLLITGRIKQKGVIPPEKIGKDDTIFKDGIELLSEEGIKITRV